MQGEFPSTAHVIHEVLKTSGISIKLGHVHQLLAACLGYSSFASYQAATGEATSLAEATHILFNDKLVRERAEILGYHDQAVRVVIAAAAKALNRRGGDHIQSRDCFRSLDEFRFRHYAIMHQEVFPHERVAAEARLLGGEYLDMDIDFARSAMGPADADHVWLRPVSGTVYLEDKEGMPMWTGLEFEAAMQYEKVGLACFKHPTFMLLSVHAVRVKQLPPEVDFEYHPRAND